MIGDLRTLLRAFAQYSSQFEPRLRIGYTQGLGVIAGFFLMHCPGEQAFWILVAVVRRLCPGWWSSSLFGFRRDADVFARLLEANDPVLAKHLADHHVDPNLYLPQQFLQLFIRTLPWPTLLRVMDVFVLDGPSFLLRLSLAVFDLHRDAILARRSQSDILELLLGLPRSPKLDVDFVLPAAFAVKIKPAQLARLRAASERTSTVKTIRRV